MKMVIGTVFIVGLLAGLILWLTGSGSTDYPSEDYIKNIYTQSLQKNNTEAQQQFGALMKKEGKMELQSFSLDKCSEQKNEKTLVCSVKLQVKSPVYGEQKRQMEFYFKPSSNGFQFVGQKQAA